MKSYAQYIAEKRTELMKMKSGHSNAPVLVNGIENPSSSKELMTFTMSTRFKESRFLIHKKTHRFLAWDSSEATHWEVMNGEEGDPTAHKRNDLYTEGYVMHEITDGKPHWRITITERTEALANKTLRAIRALKQLSELEGTVIDNWDNK